MSYGTGINLQHLWRTVDKPERVGTCAKLRQGQMLMYKYKYLYDLYRGNERYTWIADNCKRDSIILAKRMVEHAKGCGICAREIVLEEAFFYGVYK